MKTRTATAILLTLIILMSTGIGFALMTNSYARRWNKTQNCDVIFTYVNSYDNEVDKDVADVNAWITINKYTIEIGVTNAYPCYEAYVDYKIMNIGKMMLHIYRMNITNPNPEALEITIINHECTYIAPREEINGQLTLHLLQEAQQRHTYQFEITIELSCQERPHPRTIGFWKHQFQVALDIIKGKGQVDSDTLEDILNKISPESQVFGFTGLSREQKFELALDILSPPHHSSMEAKLKAQLLALWLNYFSGWTNGFKLDGVTAIEIIEGSEEALNAGQTADYEYWKDLCDRFNNIS